MNNLDKYFITDNKLNKLGYIMCLTSLIGLPVAIFELFIWWFRND